MPKIFTDKEKLIIQKDFLRHYRKNLSVKLSSQIVKLPPSTIYNWLSVKDEDETEYIFPDFVQGKAKIDSEYVELGIKVLKKQLQIDVPETKLILRYLDSDINKSSEIYHTKEMNIGVGDGNSLTLDIF